MIENSDKRLSFYQEKQNNIKLAFYWSFLKNVVFIVEVHRICGRIFSESRMKNICRFSKSSLIQINLNLWEVLYLQWINQEISPLIRDKQALTALTKFNFSMFRDKNFPDLGLFRRKYLLCGELPQSVLHYYP